MEGIGMMYAPNAVFYGRCDDPTQNWSIAFQDGYCEEDKPLLLSLVKSKKIKDKAFDLLSSGAIPDDDYGHELYVCPKCMRLANRFYFKLLSSAGDYEPDYHCAKCKTVLRRVEVKDTSDEELQLIYKNHRKIDWKCPDCGNDRIIHDGYMALWD
jgi:predicted RNA-binding Zn-ribbon protein involved in translation (DUF1610 family)